MKHRGGGSVRPLNKNLKLKSTMTKPLYIPFAKILKEWKESGNRFICNRSRTFKELWQLSDKGKERITELAKEFLIESKVEDSIDRSGATLFNSFPSESSIRKDFLIWGAARNKRKKRSK